MGTPINRKPANFHNTSIRADMNRSLVPSFISLQDGSRLQRLFMEHGFLTGPFSKLEAVNKSRSHNGDIPNAEFFHLDCARGLVKGMPVSIKDITAEHKPGVLSLDRSVLPDKVRDIIELSVEDGSAFKVVASSFTPNWSLAVDYGEITYLYLLRAFMGTGDVMAVHRVQREEGPFMGLFDMRLAETGKIQFALLKDGISLGLPRNSFATSQVLVGDSPVFRPQRQHELLTNLPEGMLESPSNSKSHLNLQLRFPSGTEIDGANTLYSERIEIEFGKSIFGHTEAVQISFPEIIGIEKEPLE